MIILFYYYLLILCVGFQFIFLVSDHLSIVPTVLYFETIVSLDTLHSMFIGRDEHKSWRTFGLYSVKERHSVDLLT